MAKSQVYSWRVSAEMLAELERAARTEGRSVAAHLEHVVAENLARRRADTDDDEAQRRLHAAAEKIFGTVRTGPPLDASRVREGVRERLRRRHGR